MSKILLTGGCGYIGSHTAVDLIENGFEVIILDSNIRSEASNLDNVQQVTGQRPIHYPIDLCDKQKLQMVFGEHPDIAGIIHFAALKSVPESVEKPLVYYHNNLTAMMNLLDCAKTYSVGNFIFSSSCSVYGNAKELPVVETTPHGHAESPYAYTKQVGERMLEDWVKATGLQGISLRYFNPAGAHPSLGIGETPQKGAYNVVPILMEYILSIRSAFTIYGGDYNTRDGSCIRDYIHVSDVAHAHTKAVEYLLANKNTDKYEIFNVALGQGVTVLELVQAFERANNIKVNYTIGERRAGDVEAIYANASKVMNVLGWQPKYSIEDMMRTSWQWEQKRRKLLTTS